MESAKPTSIKHLHATHPPTGAIQETRSRQLSPGLEQVGSGSALSASRWAMEARSIPGTGACWMSRYSVFSLSLFRLYNSAWRINSCRIMRGWHELLHVSGLQWGILKTQEWLFWFVYKHNFPRTPIFSNKLRVSPLDKSGEWIYTQTALRH